MLYSFYLFKILSYFFNRSFLWSCLSSFLYYVVKHIFAFCVTDTGAWWRPAHPQHSWGVPSASGQHFGRFKWSSVQPGCTASPPPTCGSAHSPLHITCSAAEWSATFTNTSEGTFILIFLYLWFRHYGLLLCCCSSYCLTELMCYSCYQCHL